MAFRGRRLTISLLTGLVVLVVVGSGAAVALSHHRDGIAEAGPTIASTADTGSRSAAGGTHQPAAPTQATDTSTGPSNNLTVQMAPAVQRQPRAADVQQLLQGYFDAINQHNYAGWTQTVTDNMADSQNSAQWLDAYATTVDSSIWMRSMTADPLRVGVHFTSQQDPDLAPKDLPVGCIDWTIVYQIESQHGRLTVGQAVPGSVTKAKC